MCEDKGQGHLKNITMNLTIDHVIDNNATVKFITLSQVISLMSRSLLQERLDFSSEKEKQRKDKYKKHSQTKQKHMHQGQPKTSLKSFKIQYENKGYLHSQAQTWWLSVNCPVLKKETSFTLI